jgi:DNA-binding HxlR family transcriptional regulator
MSVQSSCMMESMPQQRGYRDACGIAHALDLIGERWALLVVRELLFGPKRFTDLRRDLPAASPNALADRLQELAEIGVVRRRRLPRPAASWVYELTDWGCELEPILVSLGSWAIRSDRHDGTGNLSAASVMLTIRTYFSGDATGILEVRLGEDQFGVLLSRGRADVHREPPAGPDAVIISDPVSLSASFGDSHRLRAALDNVTVTGDRQLATRLLTSVRVPPPAPSEARR